MVTWREILELYRAYGDDDVELVDEVPGVTVSITGEAAKAVDEATAILEAEGLYPSQPEVLSLRVYDEGGDPEEHRVHGTLGFDYGDGEVRVGFDATFIVRGDEAELVNATVRLTALDMAKLKALAEKRGEVLEALGAGDAESIRSLLERLAREEEEWEQAQEKN